MLISQKIIVIDNDNACDNGGWKLDVKMNCVN